MDKLVAVQTQEECIQKLDHVKNASEPDTLGVMNSITTEEDLMEELW